VIHALGGEQDILQMGGLARKVKVTFITFLIACIAIAGIPPFSGFFSKDEILIAAWNSSPIYFIVGVIGSLLTAAYMFRLLSMTFAGTYRGAYEEHKIHESPNTMTLPLIILAILSIAGGWVGIPEVLSASGNKFEQFLEPVFAKTNSILALKHSSHQTEWILMSVSTILVLITAVWAWWYYRKGTASPAPNSFVKAMEKKFYVDEIYNAIIIRPLTRVSTFFENILDKKVVDGFVNGVGKGVTYGSRQLRLLQSGQVTSYILLMVLGLIILFAIQMIF